MGTYSLRFLCILTVVPFILSFLKVNSQIQGCSLVGLDLQHCLSLYTNPSISLDSCCTTLNLAIQAGYHCLCALLSPSDYPIMSITLSLSFSGCYVSLPPLTRCSVLESTPVLAPPVVAAAPVLLNQPPPGPMLQPPDLPKDEFGPPTPKGNQIPIINSEHNDSSTVDSEPVASNSPFPKLGIPPFPDHSSSHVPTTNTPWRATIIFVAAICACIA